MSVSTAGYPLKFPGAAVFTAFVHASPRIFWRQVCDQAPATSPQVWQRDSVLKQYHFKPRAQARLIPPRIKTGR